ncbi:unnamed protein product [Linum tenue]|uniref:C2H2-type domain-containing protein n=1 Tax=Linum tenue TaxID=586396 RepID=A0AAV0NF52_9ROSI|nr:unnamed protein product [Linum tenue]
MEEDHQESKHVCKYCGKRCRSGKSLGGHLRSHMRLFLEESSQPDAKRRLRRKLFPLSNKKLKREEEDVEAFVASLDRNHETCPSRIVSKLIRERAIGCLSALLERKIPHNRLDLFDDSREPFIFDAAERGFYGAVELFLRHGVPPSARLPAAWFRLRELLPIDYALYPSCDDQWDLETEENGYYRQRLCTLMLWLPKWISKYFDWWRTVKLLAQATEQGILEMRIFRYARNGQAAKLLWLLLAVPDRVLSPTFFRGTFLQQRFGTASLSLRDFLIAQLAFVTGVGLTVEPNRRPHPDGIRGDVLYKKSSLTCSLRLLEVFRRAGPQLCRLMAMLEKEKQRRKEQGETYPYPDYTIAQQFRTVLKEAGFPVASLRCPVRTAHQSHKEETDYGWLPQRDDYPELEFLIRPPHVRRSEILDSDFNKAIEKLCQHPHLKEWTSQMSIFKLLFIFCLPDVVENMQSVLRFELKDINPSNIIQPAYLADLCFIYVVEGRIVEFTSALVATQVHLQLEYPLCPKMFYDDGDYSYKSATPTVYESLLHAMTRVIDEEISLIGKPKDNDYVQVCKEKKSLISSAFLLTKIVEKSAEDIHCYLHSSRYKELGDLKLIVKDVAALLRKRMGFVLRSRHTCVNDLKCFSNKSGIGESNLEGKLSSFGPLSKRVKPSTVSKRTIEGSTFLASSISKLSARSYHSYQISRFEGSKASLPSRNRVNFVVKKLEATKRLDTMSRKSWRFLAVITRVMTWF